MQVTFISQGYNPDGPNYIKAVDKVCSFLSNPKVTKFQAFVAFANEAGVASILPDIESFIKRGGTAHLFVGIDLLGSSKEALESLLNAAVPTSIVHSRNSVTYHPKVYTFEGDNYCAALVGSSNLTRGGLDQNIEASIFIEGENASYPEAKSVIDSINSQYEKIINGSADICSVLTVDILQLLLDSKVVISENESRRLHNIQNDGLSTTLENRKRMKNTFGISSTEISKKSSMALKTSRIGGKPSFDTDVLRNPNENSSIVSHLVYFKSGSMWIWTGEMTGGSRNIIDLSMHGKRDGVVYPGASSFFMENPNDHDAEHDVTIIYDGKRYEGNTIKYTTRNSNWRFQLKGETASGDKLSSFGKPRVGWSGFPHVIFVFEKTEEDNTYKLSILDESELDNLKASSVQWTTPRNGKGRPYGWL